MGSGPRGVQGKKGSQVDASGSSDWAALGLASRKLDSSKNHPLHGRGGGKAEGRSREASVYGHKHSWSPVSRLRASRAQVRARAQSRRLADEVLL